MIELNPDALAIADALDAERDAKGPRGPLHGIPILIKDNIDTADRMRPPPARWRWRARSPRADAFVVARLRAAGAVILGKTNLSEWANFRSTHSTSGWSGRGGQTRNPVRARPQSVRLELGLRRGHRGQPRARRRRHRDRRLDRLPVGANGLVGIKPTVGLVSRSGIIPIAHSQDTAGPMARTVADAAILLGALAGVDPRDAATDRRRSAAATTRQPRCAAALRGARIGVAREQFFGYSDAADRLVEEAIAAMKAQGAVIVDPGRDPDAGKFDATRARSPALRVQGRPQRATWPALGPSAPVRSLAT